MYSCGKEYMSKECSHKGQIQYSLPAMAVCECTQYRSAEKLETKKKWLSETRICICLSSLLK
jgi:hypothetical protein